MEGKHQPKAMLRPTGPKDKEIAFLSLQYLSVLGSLKHPFSNEVSVYSTDTATKGKLHFPACPAESFGEPNRHM